MRIGTMNVRRFAIWLLVPVLALALTSQSPGQDASGAAAAHVHPSATSTPAQIDGQPIHMPNLLGQSLDYATSIWDEDEALPQIVVERLSDRPDVVVVQQTPAAGTMSFMPGRICM